MSQTFALSMIPLTGPSAYLIGKGPSLDRLTATDFTLVKAPIFCLNESIHKIEALRLPNPIYCVQQDSNLGVRCRPKYALWLLSKQAEAKGLGAITVNVAKYTPEDYGLTATSLTGEIALSILALIGYTTVTMYAFDAYFGKHVNYATAIGMTHIRKGRSDTRFIGHSARLVNHAKKLNIKLLWVSHMSPNRP